MRPTAEILKPHVHRPCPVPEGRWVVYQEWNRTIFLHWKVPVNELREVLPPHLEPDTFEGEAWVSLVAFTVEKLHPRHLFPFPPVSDFHEVNVRTYVTKGTIPGIYFLSIEASRWLSAKLTRALSWLPYEKTKMHRSAQGAQQVYTSLNSKAGFRFASQYVIGKPVGRKSLLDRWLTERYAVYLERANHVYRFQVHHQEWPLYEAELKELHTEYRFGNIRLNRPPALVHYSPGVEVLTWWRESIE